MNIKEALKKKGKTISEIAAALKITPSALSQQIANDTLTVKRLKDMAKAADMPLSELVSGDTLATIRTEIDDAFARIDERARQWEGERLAMIENTEKEKRRATTAETAAAQPPGGTFSVGGRGR